MYQNFPTQNKLLTHTLQYTPRVLTYTDTAQPRFEITEQIAMNVGFVLFIGIWDPLIESCKSLEDYRNNFKWQN